MAKMFVRYSGNVEAFKAAGLETTYNNSVVFIGNGEAVYTHGKYYGDVKAALAALEGKVDGLKYFSKISDGTNVATVGEANGTITFSATDPSEVSVDVDAKGVKIGLSEAFKTQVNTTLPGQINAVSVKLGEKDAAAASGADASAFGRIKNLETIVAGLTGEEGGEVESVDAKITKAIEALDVDAKAGDFVAGIKQVDGKIEATMGTFNFDEAGAAATAKSEVIGAEGDASSANTVYGAKKYAEEKASAAQSAAEATAAADATSKANAAKDAAIADAAEKYQLKGNYETAGAAAQALNDAKAYANGLASNYDAAGSAAAAQTAAEKTAKDYTDAEILKVNNAASTLEGRVKANEDNIATLNGEGEGSVKKQVADAIAGVVASAPEDFDTLKEIADWIGSDTTGAAQMQSDIATLKGGDTVEGSVAKTVKDAVAAEAEIARAAEKANADAIDAIEADYLKSADKTALQESINGVRTDLTAALEENERVTAEAYTDLDGRVTVLEGKNSIIDSALQAADITTGSANGTIAVKGTDVAVKGLGSAAFAEASAFDAAGAASTAESNAKGYADTEVGKAKTYAEEKASAAQTAAQGYADSLAGNYATAAQGAKADAAAPQATTYNKTEVDAMWAWEEL